MWLFIALCFISLADLLIGLKPAGKYCQLLSLSLMPAWMIIALVYLLRFRNIGAVVIAILIVYQIVNIARLEIGTASEAYRQKRFLPSALWLSLMILILAILIWRWPLLGLSSSSALVSLAVFSLLVAISSLSSLIYSLRRYQPAGTKTSSSPKLPAVSVLIPARNETDDLIDCLDSLVKSSYPKLEVIVLDDCSQTKKTPGIIRSFAGHGVRFLAGHETPDGWLSKNYALEQLALAASGQLLLFAGVDTRFEPDTVTKLVSCLVNVQKDMICFLPPNHRQMCLKSYLLQPLRYGWEVVVPRFLGNRPAVLSTCWLIKRSSLKQLGGFLSVKHKIVPESYLAANTNYIFQLSPQANGLSSQKHLSAQAETAVRIRYPQLNRRLELAAAMTIFSLGLIIGPVWLLLVGLISNYRLLISISLAAILFNLITYACLDRLTYRCFRPLSLVIQPLAALYELYLINYSLYKYEFSEVAWKGRNACLPVMQVVAALPKP